MKLSCPALLVLAAGLWFCAVRADGGQRPLPNVLVFLVDDMGWQDTSVPFCYEKGEPVVTDRNRGYRTPNMERLARSGMKFTDAYAAPVCSPTRVSLITGMNAARHRVTNWTLRKDTRTDNPPRDAALRAPAWNVNGLSSDPSTPSAFHTPTLPQLVRKQGYRTIHVGKAHWGAIGTPGADPKNLGFDVNIAGHAAGAPGSYLGQKNYAHERGERVWDTPGLEKYHGTETFLTEALTIEALREVDEALAAGRPFFLYLAHYAVHVPFAPDPRFYPAYGAAGLDHTEAMYAALIEGMDHSLGRVLDHLETRGVADHTFVLFLSDNGGLSAQGRSGTPHTHNLPLRSGKGSAFEGGIRVPMLARWPGVTRPGSVCVRPVIAEDVFPTVLEICGTRGARVDGVSLVPLLRGRPGKERPLVWHYPDFWGPTGPGIEPFSAIRRGQWKLIHYYTDGREELYNLAQDLGEEHNVADREPRRAWRLSRELGEFLESVDAQTPVRISDGRAVPLPGGRPAAAGRF